MKNARNVCEKNLPIPMQRYSHRTHSTIKLRLYLIHLGLDSFYKGQSLPTLQVAPETKQTRSGFSGRMFVYSIWESL
ncbi:unnamed protein product [Hermetia illucens]|uniref:Uncharacterized protein n=1 Tax=Hermetia illucens TaxID=343691 RepID=A0A7R8YR61_HERIL|nr:unnamed protein product [Hermetia illucens]